MKKDRRLVCAKYTVIDKVCLKYDALKRDSMIFKWKNASKPVFGIKFG